jgi:hypothetical protein
MTLEAPYSEWVKDWEFPFWDDDSIGWGLDSSIYLKNWEFWKMYLKGMHPWTIIDYHRIHATLSNLWPQELTTEIWNLVISVLDFWPVYRDENRGYFSLAPYIDWEKLIEVDEMKVLNQVRESLHLNKIWTHAMLSHNAKITSTNWDTTHITITDLWGTIPSFVDANRWLIDTTIKPNFK